MASLDTTSVQKNNIDNGDLYKLLAYSKSLKQMVRLVIRYSRGDKAQVILFYRSGNERERCYGFLRHPFSDRVLLQGCQRLHRTDAIAGKGRSKAIVQLVYFTPKVYQYFNPKVYHLKLICKLVLLVLLFWRYRQNSNTNKRLVLLFCFSFLSLYIHHFFCFFNSV